MTLTLLLRLAVEFPRQVTSANAACPGWSLPQDLKEWPDVQSGDNVEVIWSFDRVCGSVSTCFKNISSSYPVNFVVTNQLPPVQIRPDQTISFRAGTADASVQLVYYHVDEDGFLNCSTTEDKRIDINQDTKLGIFYGTLFTGNNYFIANNLVGRETPWQCFPYGLRVNVTVQERDCSPMEPNSGLLCNGRGRCAVRMYESNYACHCCPGYIGEYCERIDGCYGVRCIQGTCQDGPDDNISPGFTCNCDPGFTGVLCDSVAGEPCLNNNCMYGGLCVQSDVTSYGFRCFCRDGFTGKVCETDVDDCQSNPCVSGQCQDAVNAYRCQCDEDHTGSSCETYIGPCPPDRCFNGGTCRPLGGLTRDSVCDCTSDYTGSSCETKVEICHSTLCANAVDCIQFGQEFKCVCNPGYTGKICDVNVDECASSPCLNGGTCRDHVAFFTCECSDNLTQPVCERPRDPAPDKLHDAKKTAADAMVGLTIALSVIGTLLGIALVILLIYYCTVHKPYKRLRLRKKYVHIVDERSRLSKTSIRSGVYGSEMATVTQPGGETAGDDVSLGAHPSPDFQADASPADDAEVVTGGHTAKSPLVRRVKHSEQSRV